MNSAQKMRANARKMYKYISANNKDGRKYLDFNNADDVSKFQREYGLNVNGKLDITTFERLTSLYQSVKTERADFASIPMGNKCDFQNNRYNILNLQILMNEISELFCNLVPVELTGEYDKQTKAAVMDLQTVFGVPSNGIVTKYFWNMLVKTKESLLNFLK